MHAHTLRSSLSIALVLGQALTGASLIGCSDSTSASLGGTSYGSNAPGNVDAAAAAPKKKPERGDPTAPGSGGAPSDGGPSPGADAGQRGTGPTPSTNADAGSPAATAANFSLSLDTATLGVDLASAADLVVSVSPNGYQGDISLAAKGFPADVTVAFANPTLSLDGVATQTSKITLTTTSVTVAGAIAFTIEATSAAGTASAAAALTVNSAITIRIPPFVADLGGTIANPYRLAFGPNPITISAPSDISDQNPVIVRFFNADSVPHEIHASSPGAGFPHDPGPIQPQSMDRLVRRVTTAGEYDFYLHDQNGPATTGRIIIQ